MTIHVQQISHGSVADTDLCASVDEFLRRKIKLVWDVDAAQLDWKTPVQELHEHDDGSVYLLCIHGVSWDNETHDGRNIRHTQEEPPQ
jgi:hypothetical protein